MSFQLCRTVEVTYSVRVTRDEAIEYLSDAGAAEEEIRVMSDEELLAAMISPDSEFSDDVGARLEDYAVEVDSGARPWEKES